MAVVEFADGAGVLLESLPDGVVVCGGEGRIVYANRAAEAMTGYSREELRDQPLEMLLPTSQLARHEPDRTEHDASGRGPRAVGGGQDIWLRRRDGAEVPVDVSSSPVAIAGVAHVLAVVRDATERRTAESRLAQRAALLELAHDSVLVRSFVDSRISFWNQGAVDTYRYSRQEALGSVSHELLKAVFPESAHAVQRALGDTGRWDGEIVHTRKDGSGVVVSSRQLVLPDRDGRPDAVLEINRDITSEKAAHERLAVLVDRERLAREIHDGAIQAILGVGLALQAAAGRTDDPELRGRLESAVDELDSVTKELRGYIFELRPGVVADLGLEAGLRRLAGEIGIGRGMDLDLAVDPEVAELLGTRLVDVLQVAREAMANAQRHGAAGRCHVGLRREDGAALLEIEDDGAGFDHAAPTPGGNGLRNMRERADRLGGQVSVVSTPGRGTAVRLSFPV